MKLNNLIGFKEDLNYLTELLSKNKLPHAIIISGKESIGKRLFARKITERIIKHKAESLGKITEIENDQIGQQIINGTYSDLHLIDPPEEKSGISIEQIRNLISILNLKSYYPYGAVAIINDAHLMSISAANCLLKSLEEPEENKVFLLISHETHLIPETIRSRAQIISCKSRSKEELQQIIKLLIKKDYDMLDSNILDILEGSLSSLNISPEIDPSSLKAKNEARLEKKIQEEINSMKDILHRLNKIMSIKSKFEIKSQLIQFLRENSKNPSIVRQKISLLAFKAREKMINGSEIEQERWSNFLMKLSQSINEVRIRHLDPEISIACCLD